MFSAGINNWIKKTVSKPSVVFYYYLFFFDNLCWDKKSLDISIKLSSVRFACQNSVHSTFVAITNKCWNRSVGDFCYQYLKGKDIQVFVGKLLLGLKYKKLNQDPPKEMFSNLCACFQQLNFYCLKDYKYM